MSTEDEQAAAAKAAEAIDVSTAPAAPPASQPAGRSGSPAAATATASPGEPADGDTTLSLKDLTRATAAAVGVSDVSEPEGAPRNAVAGAEDKGTATTITDNIRLGKTREQIAFRLIGLLAVVVGGYLLVSLSFSQACWESDSCSVKDAYGMAAGSFATVFAALLGLVGSVVGFYFGSRSET